MMAQITEICNYLPLGDRIASSGQPTVEQFAAIQAAAYGVVINLAMPSSENWLPQEPEVVTQLGMQYIPIPVVWDYPTLEDLEQLFDALAEHREERVWVHCALNMRVSAMMYLYHRIRLGMDDSSASAYLRQIWVPNETWQRFMDAAIELYGE